MGVYYRFNGQYDEAVASFRNAIRLSPDYVGAQEEIGVALLLKDEPEAALSAMAKVQTERARVRGMALALHALGRQAEFEFAFKELRERWGAQRPLSVADVYAWIGDADRAFEWLDRAFQQNAYALARIAFSEIFNGIHDDPRWLPFLERIGMSPEQLAVIDFEVTLPE